MLLLVCKNIKSCWSLKNKTKQKNKGKSKKGVNVSICYQSVGFLSCLWIRTLIFVICKPEIVQLCFK